MDSINARAIFSSQDINILNHSNHFHHPNHINKNKIHPPHINYITIKHQYRPLG